MSDYRKKYSAAERIEFSLNNYENIIRDWETDPELSFTEGSLRQAFKVKGILSRETEFIRMCLLNQIYSTRLSTRDLFVLADYVVSESDTLNGLIREGNADAVNKITTAVKRKNKGNYCYSFATKYCSFMSEENSNHFPIYDSYMEAVYWAKRNEWNSDNDTSFTRDVFYSWKGDTEENDYENTEDSNRYQNYCQAVEKMRLHLSNLFNIDIEDLTVKKLDQYLWRSVKLKYVQLYREEQIQQE